MRNDLYHASGWTKKDHKYIRKEGNRYIYPEDLKKSIGNKVHEIGSRINEKRNLSKRYTRDMGYPGSRNRMGVVEDGIYSRSTGNAGSGNLRTGVEAGRRRAGIKPSGNVNGVQNNLRNKGYNASTDANWKNADDNFNGSYNHRNTRTLDGTSYNDLHASRTKHDNEKIRQNRDRNYNRETPEKNELSRGTEAGRKRVQQKAENQAKNRAAAVNGTGAKNQEFAKNQTLLRNTKKAYEESGGKPLREIPLKVNGKTINLKMDDKQYDRYVAESPETTPQERAKAITKIRKKAAAANGTGAKNQEYAKTANVEQKVKKQAKNRATAANGIVIGKDGKPYRFNLDQYYAKQNVGGKKTEQYLKDYSQNEDGTYGAKEGGNFGWTERYHTHSSEPARKASIEKKAYEAEVKEAVKKTKARNKAEKEKLTKKGKQIVDKIKSRFSKKKQ